MAGVAALLALTPQARSEVVEEETWYGASGEVVKTVKRTYTGRDVPARQSTWEPSWVIRDRQQSQRRSQYSGRPRYGRSRSYGGYYGRYYYAPVRYYHRYPCYTGYRSHYGGSGWRVSYSRGRLYGRVTIGY